MVVSRIIGDQIGLPYSKVVQVMTEYVLSSVSLDFPQYIVVSTFSIFVFFSLCLPCFVYVLQKSVWGRMLDLVIFMFLSVGSVVLFIVKVSFVECSAGCGVNSIACIFERLRITLFCLVQLSMSFRYECTCCLAVFMFLLVERIVMTSAYVISFILLFGGVGMSDVHILNSFGESTPLCGTGQGNERLCFFLR